MTWVQGHPPGTTSVASTKTQFQQNNLYIETTLQVDHYFDDATAANDGHHKFVQMPAQGADPGVALAGGGCLFIKNTGFGTPSPYLQTGSGTFFVPIGRNCGNYDLLAGTTNTFNFAGLPRIRGWIFAYRTADPRIVIASNFVWDATIFRCNYRNNGKGQWISDENNHLRQFTSEGTSFVSIITDQNMTISLSWIGFLA